MHKTKWEFSKIILIYAAIINTVVVASTIIMVFFTRDCTPLIYLIPAVSAEVATGTGFYYWKARSNNLYEYGEKFVLELADKVGGETAAQIAQTFISNSRQ